VTCYRESKDEKKICTSRIWMWEKQVPSGVYPYFLKVKILKENSLPFVCLLY